jgi:Domain of unknown function (DUF1906)
MNGQRRALLLLLLAFSAAAAQSPRSSTRFFLGFDRNGYPGDQNLAALHKTFSFAGYWLNNPPGENANSWVGKRTRLREAGFGFLVLFNGKSYAQIRNTDVAAIGRNDGQIAASAATREGFPPGTIIFLDQEEGGRLLPQQRAYLHAWVDAINARGFSAGVYCSGVPFEEGAGTVIVTADDIRRNAGNRKITYWVSNDVCPPSPGCVALNAPDPARSGTDFVDVWQFAQSPRRKEMTSSCAKTYNADGECYAPGIPLKLQLHVDLNSATSADPSRGRGAR